MVFPILAEQFEHFLDTHGQVNPILHLWGIIPSFNMRPIVPCIRSVFH